MCLAIYSYICVFIYLRVYTYTYIYIYIHIYIYVLRECLGHHRKGTPGKGNCYYVIDVG